MQALDQYEGLDPEFYTDWTGLVWQGFVPTVTVTEPTDTDIDEWRLSLDDAVDVSRKPRIGFDFDRCKALAEVGLSSVEVAKIMGVETYVVNNNVRARYNCGWKEYSSRHKLALSGEIRAKIVEKCRHGNERALAMFAVKMIATPVLDPTQAPSYTASMAVSVEAGSTPLIVESTEDLQKRRLKLMAVIDRKPAFAGLEALTSTLKVVEGWHEITRSEPAVAEPEHVRVPVPALPESVAHV